MNHFRKWVARTSVAGGGFATRYLFHRLNPPVVFLASPSILSSSPSFLHRWQRNEISATLTFSSFLLFYFFFFHSLFLLHTYLLFSHRLKNFPFSFPSRSFLTPHWLLARRTWKRAPVEIWVKQRRSLLKYRRRSCLITGVGSSITH